MTTLALWIIAIALGLTAFFSAAEMAFIAANRVRLRHLAEGGSQTASRYLEAFRQPERVLSAAMMGVTIAHVTASSLATWALLPVLGVLWWSSARESDMKARRVETTTSHTSAEPRPPLKKAG